MIRGLTVVALGGALISTICFASAGLHHNLGWHVPGHTWKIEDDDNDGPSIRLTGHEPIITRSLPWTGSESISVSVPAKVTFTQGPVAAITVTGPDAMANRVVLDGDDLKLNASFHSIDMDRGLSIAITGPNLHDFTLNSAQSLDIQNLSTDHLHLEIDGAGKITAHGSARSMRLEVNGAGDAQLGGLTLADADVEINGISNVVAGPTGDVKVEINGAGNVELTRHPASLSQEINGGGHVSQPDAPAEQKL